MDAIQTPDVAQPNWEARFRKLRNVSIGIGILLISPLVASEVAGATQPELLTDAEVISSAASFCVAMLASVLEYGAASNAVHRQNSQNQQR